MRGGGENVDARRDDRVAPDRLGVRAQRTIERRERGAARLARGVDLGRRVGHERDEVEEDLRHSDTARAQLGRSG